MRLINLRAAGYVLVVASFTLACTLVEGITEVLPTGIPQASATPTTSPSTPIPTPTVTLPPIPTPLPAARIQSGDEARFAGDWDRALLEYESARANSSEEDIQSAALLGIGRTRIQAGDPEGAIQALNQLIQTYPQSLHVPYAHFALGQALSTAGRQSEAADAYLNYLTIRPGLIDAYILDIRGDALESAGRYGEALVDYRSALLAPSLLASLPIEIKIARSHAAVGDYDTALGLYLEIYRRTDSDFTKAQMDLLIGQAYIAKGDNEQAYAAYQDAVNNYPASRDFLRGTGCSGRCGYPGRRIEPRHCGLLRW